MRSSERVAIHFTGRASRIAANAAMICSTQSDAFSPNAPPTSCEITRTRLSGMPSTDAISVRIRNGA